MTEAEFYHRLILVFLAQGVHEERVVKYAQDMIRRVKVEGIYPFIPAKF